MTKTALVLASNGTEEMELTITVDVLRRADINVLIAGLQDEKTVQCANKTVINVDKLFKEVYQQTFDAVVLPGGQPGSDNFAKDSRVGELLRRHEQQNKVLAAICAAPIAFKSHKIGSGASITSYPCFEDRFEGYNYVKEKVVVWKNIITSRGPGTAFDFALKIVEVLVGEEKSKKIRSDLLLN